MDALTEMVAFLIIAFGVGCYVVGMMSESWWLGMAWMVLGISACGFMVHTEDSDIGAS